MPGERSARREGKPWWGGLLNGGDDGAVLSLAYNPMPFDPGDPASLECKYLTSPTTKGNTVDNFSPVPDSYIYCVDAHIETPIFVCSSLHSMGLMPWGRWCVLDIDATALPVAADLIGELGARPLTDADAARFAEAGLSVPDVRAVFPDRQLEVPGDGQLVFVGAAGEKPVFSRYHGSLPEMLGQHRQMVSFTMAKRACFSVLASGFDLSADEMEEIERIERNGFISRFISTLSCGTESLSAPESDEWKWERLAHAPECVGLDQAAIAGTWFADASAKAARIGEFASIWRELMVEEYMLPKDLRKIPFGDYGDFESGLRAMEAFGREHGISEQVRALRAGVPLSDIVG